VIHILRRCYKIVYRQGLTVEDAIKALDELAAQHPEVDLFRQSTSKPAFYLWERACPRRGQYRETDNCVR
ncbi:hypothetical protein OO306_01920, partial [Pseudomonas sp. DCB_AW]|nr:hypothetical protein [Pseudomonas sp. DCB_AW]